MASQRHDEEQAEKSFSVSDKRLFTKEGERRAEAAPLETPPPPPPPRPEPPRAEAPRRQRPETGEPPRRDLPQAGLASLVSMLATNAMVFMGQMPAPGTQQFMRNLPQAQHMIDLLMVLRDKTQGNLTLDEDQMLQELLPQLQMAYVSASRQVG